MIIMSQNRKHLINAKSVTDFELLTVAKSGYAIFADDLEIANYSAGSQAIEEFERLAADIADDMRTFEFRPDEKEAN